MSEFHVYAKLIYKLSPFELCIYYTACCLQQIYDDLIAPMQIFFGFKHQTLNVFSLLREKNRCAEVDTERFYYTICCSY